MNPVAFSIGGFDIRWYGILIATGIMLGILISQYNCKWREVDYDNLLNIVLLSIPIGIIGARLYYVIFEFDNYKDNIINAFNIRNGGLAIHGGLIFALGTALIYTRVKKLSFIKFADVAAPSIILAQALGRWGNFFNQEAHGDVVSYEFIKHFPMFIQKGMNINGLYYNPTFLYESLWNLTIFIILMIMLRKCKKNGIVFFTYIGLYSIGRFIIEGMRTDSLMIGSFRMAQLVSLAGVIAWIIFIAASYYNSKSKENTYKE
ncbi:prolipoprotein diacylglyceryl transferase [Clostridium diolis]|uniref:Phosphatidylglycerol--prolipoprotein diacylglyceryl transferase n=1 Tax=Clostridium diolis TaxID=223919 RepID=A0AAV3VXE0_9CLOT|nr:prolipoprotein diacylglyceryl transferase [Clostridium diolis]QES74102.1 prolipoprotein diacylglyceryl transferase [Clostridium diolis]GEA30650.1 prolipoprotein diacylglyceryl transferase [Clostridium diolis]